MAILPPGTQKALDLNDQPSKRNRPALERAIHIAIADTLTRLARPEWYWTHIPSGEYRTQATGRLLKRMGVKAGIPDFLLIDADGRTHWLELKRERTKLSKEQQAFEALCNERHIPHEVAYGFGEAKDILLAWGVLRDGVKFQ